MRDETLDKIRKALRKKEFVTEGSWGEQTIEAIKIAVPFILAERKENQNAVKGRLLEIGKRITLLERLIKGKVREEAEKRTKKVNIILSKKAVGELEELRKKLGLATIGEVIKSSVCLNKFIQEEMAKGNELILRNKKTRTERTVTMIR